MGQVEGGKNGEERTSLELVKGFERDDKVRVSTSLLFVNESRPCPPRVVQLVS